VARRRAARVGFRIKSFDSQNTHEPLRALAVHAQRDRHTPAAEEGTLQIQLVEPPNEPQVLGTLRPRLAVRGRARQSEQVALLLDGQARMLRIDP
jgi:hypothetical protein